MNGEQPWPGARLISNHWHLIMLEALQSIGIDGRKLDRRSLFRLYLKVWLGVESKAGGSW